MPIGRPAFRKSLPARKGDVRDANFVRTIGKDLIATLGAIHKSEAMFSEENPDQDEASRRDGVGFLSHRSFLELTIDEFGHRPVIDGQQVFGRV
jgi:hypothetical protein